MPIQFDIALRTEAHKAYSSHVTIDHEILSASADEQLTQKVDNCRNIDLRAEIALGQPTSCLK